MAKYPFLSDEWLAEARRIYEQAHTTGPVEDGPSLVAARANLVVTEAPFSAEPLQAHLDTSAGQLQIDRGHLEKPDVTVSMSYDTARALFVAGDMSAVMQAFLGGRIRVDGDLSKLLDPRSGMWPARPLAAPGSPPPPPPAEGAPPLAGQAGLGLQLGTDVAQQLQDITE